MWKRMGMGKNNNALTEFIEIEPPDYTVEHLRYDATDGDGWLYRARIRNIGSGGVYSGVSSTVEWSVDGNPVSTATINGLGCGRIDGRVAQLAAGGHREGGMRYP